MLFYSKPHQAVLKQKLFINLFGLTKHVGIDNLYKKIKLKFFSSSVIHYLFTAKHFLIFKS